MAFTSLAPCLPALEDVTLDLDRLLDPEDLRYLLEALAWCPRLRALDLYMTGPVDVDSDEDEDEDDVLYWPFPDASTCAKLRGLTKLALEIDELEPYFFTCVVEALMPLTCLAELKLDFSSTAGEVPAALGQLKSLRSLELASLHNPYSSSFSLEEGCLDLPNLVSLVFRWCNLEDTEVLPGITGLQRLTRIEFFMGVGPALL